MNQTRMMKPECKEGEVALEPGKAKNAAVMMKWKADITYALKQLESMLYFCNCRQKTILKSIKEQR